MPDIDAARTSDELTHVLARAFTGHRFIVVLGFAIGAIWLLLESLPRRNALSPVIHVLLALLLCGLVVARFCWGMHRYPPNDALDIRQFSRALSRMVYFILYLVIGSQQLIRTVVYLQDNHHGAHGVGPLRPAVDGQGFLISGLLALVLIRVLAWWSWRRRRYSLGATSLIPEEAEVKRGS